MVSKSILWSIWEQKFCDWHPVLSYLFLRFVLFEKNHVTIKKLFFSQYSSTHWTMRRGSRLSWQDFWSLSLFMFLQSLSWPTLLSKVPYSKVHVCPCLCKHTFWMVTPVWPDMWSLEVFCSLLASQQLQWSRLRFVLELCVQQTRQQHGTLCLCAIPPLLSTTSHLWALIPQ